MTTRSDTSWKHCKVDVQLRAFWSIPRTVVAEMIAGGVAHNLSDRKTHLVKRKK